MNKLSSELLDEFASELSAELSSELLNELSAELLNELLNEPSAEPLNELSNEFSPELLNELLNELSYELLDELASGAVWSSGRTSPPQSGRLRSQSSLHKSGRITSRAMIQLVDAHHLSSASGGSIAPRQEAHSHPSIHHSLHSRGASSE